MNGAELLPVYAEWHAEEVPDGFVVVRYEPRDGYLMRLVYCIGDEIEILDDEASAHAIAQRMRGTLH